MRSAALCCLALLAACGPSEPDRVRARADTAAYRIDREVWQARIDSAVAEAPTEDSALGVLRGPFMDSLMAAQRRLDRR